MWSATPRRGSRQSPRARADTDGSLATSGWTPEQALADGQALLRLMTERPPSPEATAVLATIHHRYLGATKPAGGDDVARLSPAPVQSGSLESVAPADALSDLGGTGRRDVDGTNNACERAIGRWVKERSRSMRGYKRPPSVLNVSRLIAAMGNALEGPGFALAEVIA